MRCDRQLADAEVVAVLVEVVPDEECEGTGVISSSKMILFWELHFGIHCPAPPTCHDFIGGYTSVSVLFSWAATNSIV